MGSATQPVMAQPSSTGEIGYAFIARCPECVLVEVAGPVPSADLNPSMVARKILRTIDGQTDTKMSYTYSKHYFHYMVKGGLVYLSKTIEKVIDRGERIDLLVDRSEELTRDSYSFRRSSTDLKRAMMCQNFKMIML